jgi:hypothetical protein
MSTENGQTKVPWSLDKIQKGTDFPKYVGPMDMSDKFWLGPTIFYSESVCPSGFLSKSHVYKMALLKVPKRGKKRKSEEHAEQQ